ncbi:MAG: hypothetical protein KAJ46_05175 [Sedimentisphaerales bacterium]|nr:hypothetical protein [Sedimentisphaerales bacterium]
MTKKIIKEYHLRIKDILIIISILLINGCATLQFPDYSPQKSDQPQYSQVKDGVFIAIHPLVDKVEMEKYFKVDLLGDNILAVFITVENRTPSSSYIVSKDHLLLENLGSGVNTDLENTQIGNDSKGQAVMSLGVISAVVFIPIGAKMVSDAGMIRHNFLVKEIKTTTLFPGQQTNGFAYFKLPQQSKNDNLLMLEINIKEIESGATKTFNFTFDLAVNKK